MMVMILRVLYIFPQNCWYVSLVSDLKERDALTLKWSTANTERLLCVDHFMLGTSVSV